jgi:hypothetical protein
MSNLKIKEGESLVNYIKSYKKKTIELSDMESVVSGKTTYEVFAKIILDLQNEGILIPNKSAKTNHKKIPLPLKYTINKGLLTNQDHVKLQKKQFDLHPSISLDAYFKLDMKIYENDLPYIEKINDYIKNKGLPEFEYIPELSFHLVNDEKWIDEKQGKAVLKRIKLWQVLNYNERIDPVAFAINPSRMYDPVKKHLILENKTPFLHAMAAIEESNYATVIYGQGWKITSSIQLFEKQIGGNQMQEYDYFGDLDSEGLSIYEALRHKISVRPAGAFYKALFLKDSYEGKSGQRYNHEAMIQFARDLEDSLEVADKEAIKHLGSIESYVKTMIESNHYQPQELLNKDEIRCITIRSCPMDKEA